MEKIVRYLLIALFGVIAQLVDGSLGMGYGVTSASLLLFTGFGTAMASAIVHFSEVFTTLASGLSHFKFGNFDKKIFTYLAVSGVIGGIVGAYTSAKLQDNDIIKPFVSGILLLMGIIIIIKNFNKKGGDINYLVPRIRKLLPLGFIAAFIDAIGGGGWGPIATPSLIVTNTHPKKAIGSVNLAEFFVTFVISITFFFTLPRLNFSVILPLTIGALITAPIAAIITQKINHKSLGLLVGILISFLSIMNILKSFNINFIF